jgi:hypothetical protein
LASPLCGRYTEPTPREDGIRVPGKRTFIVQTNVWGLNGLKGNLLPIPGQRNSLVAPHVAEYVKHVLRGRAPWGLKVRLSGEWAQLPKKRLELTNDEAMPRAEHPKRKRGD